MVDVFDRHEVRFDPRLAGCSKFVRHSDYATLEAQLVELEAENERFRKEMASLSDKYSDLYIRYRTGGVTEAMVEAAVQAVRQYTRETLFIDEHRELVRSAIRAAMEAGR